VGQSRHVQILRLISWRVRNHCVSSFRRRHVTRPRRRRARHRFPADHSAIQCKRRGYFASKASASQLAPCSLASANGLHRAQRDADVSWRARHRGERHRARHARGRAALYRYNAALRQYLLEGHYMDSDTYHSLPGSVLIDRLATRSARGLEMHAVASHIWPSELAPRWTTTA